MSDIELAVVLINDFVNKKPTESKELLHLMSACPLNINLIAMVQKAMLPYSTDLHMQDVIYSGIVRPSGFQMFEDYEFITEARGVLLRRQAKGVTLEVLETIESIAESNDWIQLDRLAIFKQRILKQIGVELR